MDVLEKKIEHWPRELEFYPEHARVRAVLSTGLAMANPPSKQAYQMSISAAS
jgi:hypothetical protein